MGNMRKILTKFKKIFKRVFTKRILCGKLYANIREEWTYRVEKRKTMRSFV